MSTAPTKLPAVLDLSSPTGKVVQPAAADVYKVVNEHFRNDINAIWQRSNYFMLVNLGLLAFLYSVGFDRTNPDAVQALCLLGLATSGLWVLITLSTERWIDVWRRKVVEVEKCLVASGPFTLGEGIDGWKLHQILRPERFAILLALLSAFLWIVFLRGWIPLK